MEKSLSYTKLFRFFLPLAVTPLLIASTHSIVNASLARLPFPELSIAVFSVVQAFTNTLKAPGLMANQLFVSLVDDRQSLRLARRFVCSLGAVLFALLVTLAYTPVGAWFLVTVIGLRNPEAVSFAYKAMRITCFLPIVEILRNTHQGLAISVRRTSIVSLGTITRIILISLFLYWAVQAQAVEGIVAGALVWTAGIGIEGVVIFLFLLWHYRSYDRLVRGIPQKNDQPIDFRQVIRFFVPLGMMIIMRAALQPMIQGGIARSPGDPTYALAAYGVAWGLIMVITGPLGMLHQCPLVFATSTQGQQWQRVKYFCLGIGGLVTLILLAIALSPFGYLVLRRGIGVSAEIAAQAAPVFLGFAFFPLLKAISELYWGLMMRKRRTSIVGVSMAAHLIISAASLSILVSPWLANLDISPAVAGAIAFSLGQGAESLVLWAYFAKSQRASGQPMSA